MKRSTASLRCGASAGAMIATVAVIILAGAGDPSSLPKDLKLVSADSAGFVSVRVSDIWESEFGKQAREQVNKFMQMVGGSKGRVFNPMAQLKKLEEMIGMKITDIERVTAVMPEFDPEGPGPGFYLIVLAKKPFDQKKITALLRVKEQTHNGKTYFANRGMAIYFPEQNLAVLGGSKAMKKVLQQKAKSSGALASALQKAAEGHHIVAGFHVPTELKQQVIRELNPNKAPGKFLLPMLEMESSTVVVDMKDDLTVSVTSNFSDDEKAKKAEAALQKGIDLLKAMAKQNLAQLPKKARKSVRTTLDSLKVVQSGKAVEVSLVAKEPAKVLQGLLVPAVRKVRAAVVRTETMNHFKMIGLTMHDYAVDHRGQLPPAAIRDKQGKPLLSWRVAILPYLEHSKLYKQFKLDEPWNSEHNIKLLSKMPKTYAHPAVKNAKKGMTFFQVFTGPGTIFEKGARTLTHITNFDGTSNTILTAEAAKAVPWTAPQDIPYSSQINPLTQVGGHFSGGFIVGMADGSVRFIKKSVSEKKLRNAIGWRDGMVNDLDR